MIVPTQSILEYFASGMTQEEILEDFDYLTKEDIQACFAYAAIQSILHSKLFKEASFLQGTLCPLLESVILEQPR